MSLRTDEQMLKDLVFRYMTAPKNEMDRYLFKVKALDMRIAKEVKTIDDPRQKYAIRQQQNEIRSIYNRMKDGRRSRYRC